MNKKYVSTLHKNIIPFLLSTLHSALTSSWHSHIGFLQRNIYHRTDQLNYVDNGMEKLV